MNRLLVFPVVFIACGLTWKPSEPSTPGADAPMPADSAKAPSRPTAKSLYDAISEDNVKAVQASLEGNSLNLNTIDRRGHTPLQWAVWCKAAKSTRELIKRGAIVDIVSAAGLGDDKRIVQLLTANPAAVDSTIPSGLLGPLEFAIAGKQKEMVRLLVTRGAELNPKVPDRIGFARARRPPIAWAIEQDDRELTEFLLDKGANVDAPGVLHATRSKGMLEFLLERKASINGRNQLGRTLLHYAARAANFEHAQFLLARKADVNAPIDIESSEHGNTPLMEAIVAARDRDKEDVSMVALLIEHGANVNAKNAAGTTPLMLAARLGLPAAVKVLVERRADTQAKDAIGDTALIMSLFGWANALQPERGSKQFLEAARFLAAKSEALDLPTCLLLGLTEKWKTAIDNDAKVVDQFQWSMSPLQWASKLGHKELVQLLLAKNADADAVNLEAEEFSPLRLSALALAIENREQEICLHLLEKGANSNASQALARAVRWGNKSTVEALLARKANANAQPSLEVASPLFEAVKANRNDLVELLLSNKADVNQSSRLQPDSALHAAVSRGFLEVAKVLIASGANVNSRGRGGASPLYQAVVANRAELATLLIERGAKVDEVDLLKRTLLHHAAASGHTEIVKLLLANKAEVNLRDYQLYTPLDLALINKHAETAALLKKHGGVK